MIVVKEEQEKKSFGKKKRGEKEHVGARLAFIGVKLGGTIHEANALTWDISMLCICNSSLLGVVCVKQSAGFTPI